MPQEAQCSISPRGSPFTQAGQRGEAKAPRYTHQRGAGGLARSQTARGEWGAGAWLPTSRRVVLI